MAVESPAQRRRRHRLPLAGIIGGSIVTFWLAMTIIGPYVAPYDVGALVDDDVFGHMRWAVPLGSDFLGRDVMSRILVGARYTVGVAAAATFLAVLIGGTLGMLAAVSRGAVDMALSRFFDALISIPSKMAALVIIAALGSSIPVLIGTAAMIYTPGAFRIWRALAINVSTLDFVEVARARGEGTGYLIRQEILPNIAGPVLTDFGMRFVFAVLILSSLSFLGLGVQPPDADWGSLVRENITGLADGALAVVMPAGAIATLTIGVNLLIDNLPGRWSLSGEH
ncbi:MULTISPECIES: ABC transporter permease [unclassified Bradyrhizobium]|uniref:ABC transporter permease n=1 Tax=unclassified Bradyrhizobium TaxID=2631580 RepID=UPI001FF71C5F|nr:MULTISPECIES: ABC transporter permease [unclassified Bradyrhizobium]MCK1614605.1 ABC transporter permease [Bradyrhizobium sp. 163]MCK1764006.1 ABC transporter permease [Bradyrhizobium sp. 136]